MPLKCTRLLEFPLEIAHVVGQTSKTEIIYEGPLNEIKEKFWKFSSRLRDLSNIVGIGKINYDILTIYEITCLTCLNIVVFASSNFPNVWFLIDDYAKSKIALVMFDNEYELKEILSRKASLCIIDDDHCFYDRHVINRNRIIHSKFDLSESSFSEIFPDGRLTKAAR
jgi:hypothetical protein